MNPRFGNWLGRQIEYAMPTNAAIALAFMVAFTASRPSLFLLWSRRVSRFAALTSGLFFLIAQGILAGPTFPRFLTRWWTLIFKQWLERNAYLHVLKMDRHISRLR